ncbi:MAG: hypothetical protein HGB06_00550 [Chlorobaculum sp.]|nr:hypothetical protein [Chlorobaculum sp.]
MKLEKSNNWIVFFVAIMMILLSHWYVFFYFPPVEGWWQVYAYLINKGFKLYRDYDMAFPPLFAIFNAALMKLSPYYVFYRVVGLIEVIGIFFFMYFAVRKLYDEKLSLIAALFGILMSVYNNVYIPNDYHTAVNLFIIISLYLLLDYHDVSKSFIRRSLSGVLMSFFLVGSFFIKQNVGLVLVVASLIGSGVSLLINRRREDSYLFVLFVLSLVLSYVFYMMMIGMDYFEILGLTASNDSKGSMATVLSRIVMDERNREFLVKGLLYFIILFLFYPWLRDGVKKIYPDAVWLFEVVVFVFLSIVFFRDPDDTAVVIVIIYLYSLIYLFFIKREYNVLLLPLFALIYANSMTAGLCVGGLFIIMPFAVSSVFGSMISDFKRVRFEYLYYPFIGVLFFSLIINKQEDPYRWWGLRQGPIAQAKYELPYYQLKYFKVDRATYQLFSDIKSEIDNKSHSIDDLYLYPDIPIFYQLHNKIPVTKNIVQWFDVIGTSQFNEELTQIKKKNPRLIIMLDPPWDVYKGHAAMKQSRLLQPDFIKYMDSQVSCGVYKLVKYQIYNDKLFGDNVNDEDFIGMITVVRSPEVVGKTIEELHRYGILKDNINVYTIVSDSTGVENVQNHKLCFGDQIFVYLKYSQISDFVCAIGTPDISNNTEYVLRIYELSEL